MIFYPKCGLFLYTGEHDPITGHPITTGDYKSSCKYCRIITRQCNGDLFEQKEVDEEPVSEDPVDEEPVDILAPT